MQQVLRDRAGRRLGDIRPIGGMLVAYGRSGERLGYYNPQVNVTYGVHGRRVGIGNFLAGLIINEQ